MSAFTDGSLLKDKGECGCGCGQYGTLKKPNRAGVRCVIRTCKCRSCRGRADRRTGKKKQGTAARRLGIPTNGIETGHEEHYAGALRIEVKSGDREAGPVWTRYAACEAQSEAARPIGDHRPFAAVFMPKGQSEGLVVVRLSKVNEFAAALVENWGVA